MKFGFVADLNTGNRVGINKRICIGYVAEFSCGLPLRFSWITWKCTGISATQMRRRNCPLTSTMTCLREARVAPVSEFFGDVKVWNHQGAVCCREGELQICKREAASLAVFESSAETGRFSASAGNLLPRFQHGAKICVRLLFLLQSRNHIPPTGASDCTIAFKDCKSFLSESNCRRTSSIDPTQRQLTIRSNQIKPWQIESYRRNDYTPTNCSNFMASKHSCSILQLC